MLRACVCSLVVVLLAACPKPQGKGTPPEQYCPGGAGCEKGNDGHLTVGMSVHATSPRAFEQPRADFLSRSGDICVEGAPIGSDGKPHCGDLIEDAWKDCGRDTKCPGAQDYSGPDADGSEKDGTVDWFIDCGVDRLCPGDANYPGPDADGTEGNRKFDGFWMAGFDNNIPVFDVHDDTYARALVLTNGDVSIAIVSIDAVGIFNDDIQKIRARVAQKMANPPDFIMISSTHTHEAADTMGQWGPRPIFVPQRGVNDPWFDQVLMENAAQAVVDAATSARPARVFVAQGHVGSRTREILRDSRDPQVIDDTVTVLRFTEKASGDTIGTLVNWGNHPETLADVNNRVSSDFVWALRQAMENGVVNSQGQLMAPGVGGSCLFLQGKVGGLMTSLGTSPTSFDGVVPKDRSFAKAKAVGDIVAKTALDALGSAQEVTSPLLAFGRQHVLLRVENANFQLVFVNLDLLRRHLYEFDKTQIITESNYPKVMSEVSKVQIGSVRLLGVPGELFPELGIGFDPAFAFGKPQIDPKNINPPDLSAAPQGPPLQQQLGGEVSMVVGLSGDEIGYMVPPYDYKLHPTDPWTSRAPGSHYEETNSLGPSAVPTLFEVIGRLTEWEPTP